MLFLKQTRGRPGARGHHVGDPCYIASFDQSEGIKINLPRKNKVQSRGSWIRWNTIQVANILCATLKWKGQIEKKTKKALIVANVSATI